MPIIEIKGVAKVYPLGKTEVHALRGIDFSVQEGEFLSIVGPSGSGKTTLLNMIGCIDTPTEGSVKINEKEISRLTDRQLTTMRLHSIGFIFQTFNLIPVLTAEENIEFPLLLMKKERFSKKERKRRVEKLIDEVGLSGFRKHRPYELSGGQRQRVAIARALITGPAIVLADEPTANLDSVTGGKIIELMRELNSMEKTTFIFSTHDPDVIKYATSMVKLRDGLIVN
jgi:putative ABC transport system ATP-binding protein